MKLWLVVILIVAVLCWAMSGIAPDLARVVNGIPHAIDYIQGSWPPDWSVLLELPALIVETAQMGLLGVTFGGIVAAPLSLLAARDTTPGTGIYFVARGIINLCRSIPTLLWAILFVTMIGLGPVAGVFALTVHCTGSLGKYFSESLETVYPRIKEMLDAMEVDGAGYMQTILYGLLPAVAPLFLSYLATYFEWSVRTGTVLGMVGAGGLGLRLTMAIRLFRRQEAVAIVIVILCMVIVIDLCSRLIRKRALEMTV